MTSMATQENPLNVVADIVEQQRLRLGLSRDAAARKAGINRVTWSRIEEGKRVQPVNLAKVERALEWPPGYLGSVLTGEEVVPFHDDRPHRRSTDQPIAQMFDTLRAQIRDSPEFDHKERVELLDELDEAEMRTRRVQRRIPNDISA